MTEVETSLNCHGYSPSTTPLTIQDVLKSVLIVSTRFVAPLVALTSMRTVVLTPHTDVPLDPKSRILIWDTGASYGLTPF